MNLLPVAHTVARPDRNEKIILILIRITAGCDKHPNVDLSNGTYAAICRGWRPRHPTVDSSNGMYVTSVGDGVLDIPHEHKAQIMRNNGNESSP